MTGAPDILPGAARRRGGRWGLGAIVGTVTGLAPHLLHHVGLLAGTALLAGIGGTVLFGVLGLAAMLPMLVRLRRRFRSWWAPGIAAALFAVMFMVSTLVIGPALRGGTGRPAEPGHAPSAPAGDQHTRHHSRYPAGPWAVRIQRASVMYRGLRVTTASAGRARRRR